MNDIIIYIIILGFFIHLYFGIKFERRIKESVMLGQTQKNSSILMIWVLPFFWFWMSKGILEPSGTMTKEKRKLDKSSFYEIRIKFGSDIYRVFCCFDREKVVILFNGFQKKSQKTPKKEIDKA